GDGVQLAAKLRDRLLELRRRRAWLPSGAAQARELRGEAFERVEQARVLRFQPVGRELQHLALALLPVDCREGAAQGLRDQMAAFDVFAPNVVPGFSHIPAGTRAPARTSAPAPTMAPSSMTARSPTVAPQETRASFPISASLATAAPIRTTPPPRTTARGPTV